MKTKQLLFCGIMSFMIMAISSCSDDSSSGEKTEKKSSSKKSGKKNRKSWDGILVTEYSGDIRYFDLETKEETTVYKEAGQPFVTADGNILTISDKFPKANYLVQVADPEFNNIKPVLDLSDGWFGGKIYGIKLSPDGKHLAAGITSYSDYKIDKDAVVIFDLDGNIIARFDEKYQPDWTPDGRLVMSGSLMSESSDSKVYTKSGAGIFISNKDFSSIKRMDPGFDDPAPVNISVSPDGDRIAFIKNHHVWVMDIDGENAKQLTASGGDNQESFPAWSPDGKYIACWVYKTFEKSYYTAIAIVPADSDEPVKLTDDAPVWPKDDEGYRVSGGAHQFSWIRKE